MNTVSHYFNFPLLHQDADCCMVDRREARRTSISKELNWII